LCAGPLHIEVEDRFACERGHQIEADDLLGSAQTRVTIAFWMAIEALDTEAEALRVLSSSGHADVAAHHAEEAARDAELLRELASRHLPPDDGDDGRAG
jgi:hypothetical protein